MKFSSKSRRRIQSIAPLFIVVPYIYFVLSDRFESHRERRAELDYAKKVAKEKLEGETKQEQSKLSTYK